MAAPMPALGPECGARGRVRAARRKQGFVQGCCPAAPLPQPATQTGEPHKRTHAPGEHRPDSLRRRLTCRPPPLQSPPQTRCSQTCSLRAGGRAGEAGGAGESVLVKQSAMRQAVRASAEPQGLPGVGRRRRGAEGHGAAVRSPCGREAQSAERVHAASRVGMTWHSDPARNRWSRGGASQRRGQWASGQGGRGEAWQAEIGPHKELTTPIIKTLFSPGPAHPCR